MRRADPLVTAVLAQRLHSFGVDSQPHPLKTQTARSSRNALLDVLRQHLVNQRLVADLPPPGFLTEVVQDVRVYSDGDQTPRRFAQRWATNTPHRPQLLGRSFWNVGEVNLLIRSRTRSFPYDSRVSN